jgi:hypothetical protein
MPKQVMFSDEGRAALLRGVNLMAAAVLMYPHADKGRTTHA